MKLSLKTASSLTYRRFGKTILLLVVCILPISASFGQSITGKVNTYLKEQVKETAVKGTILVAENMTDWFSEPVSRPVMVNPKPKKAGKSVFIRCQAPLKTKYVPVSKLTKRI